MSYRDGEQIKEMKKAEEDGTLKRSKKVIMNGIQSCCFSWRRFRLINDS